MIELSESSWRCQFHPGSNRSPIASRAGERQGEPMTLRHGHVSQKFHGFSEAGDHGVDPAVAVKVGERGSTMRPWLAPLDSAGNSGKRAVAAVQIHLVR